jgi:Xaa-Pro aminopeptidase
MLVFCGRRHGLFANLTRFVYFRAPEPEERRLDGDVARVEAAALEASRPGATLGAVYAAMAASYAALGHPGAEDLHHQGGSCGYLSRDVVARPGAAARIAPWSAVAWNPSLPGAKIEDTFLVSDAGADEVLTVDPRWPTVDVAGRARPALLVR